MAYPKPNSYDSETFRGAHHGTFQSHSLGKSENLESFSEHSIAPPKPLPLDSRAIIPGKFSILSDFKELAVAPPKANFLKYVIEF